MIIVPIGLVVFIFCIVSLVVVSSSLFVDTVCVSVHDELVVGVSSIKI